MKTFTYQIAYLWLSLILLLPACVQEELQQIPNEGEGILRLGVTSVASGLSSPQTKATVSLPSEITIEMIGEEGTKTETIAVDGSSMNKDIALKTGTYTVRAYAGTHKLVQNDPYFESESKSVTIRSLQLTNVELEATVKNAWIVPNVDEDLKKHYTNWAVNLVVDGNSFPLTSKEAESTNGLFVQAGKSVDLTFDGVNVLDEPKKTPLTTIQTEAAKKYLITCNPDVPQFSMELTANATHTKDGSGNLNGTDVTFVVNSFTGSNSLVQSWKVEVSYNGAVIRKYESSSVPVVGNSYTMNVVDGWPYVPQGSTLSASLTLKTGEVITPTISFNLPKPTFGVTLSAYTSYDKYAGTNGITKNVTDANNCNAETLYGISGGFTGLSLDLVDNPNYGIKEFSITLDGSDLGRFTGTSFGVNSVSLEDQTGLSWGSHTLKATMTFDGITVSQTNTHHITGLPYRGDYSSTAPSFGSATNQWIRVGTDSECKGSYGYILFKYYFDNISRNCYVFSPAFQLPNSVNVTYSTKVAYFTGGISNPTIDVYTGVSNQISSKVKDRTTSIKRINSDMYPSDNKFTTISVDASMNNNFRVCISHSETVKSNWAECWLTFKTLNVLYR